MNEATKHRLIGAIVLGCLAIIFIPILLDGEGLSSPEMSSAIPAAPPVPEIPRVTPQRPRLSETIPAPEPAQDSAAAPSPAAEAIEAPAPEAPRLDERGIPEAWSVRLASFGEISNADNLVERLLARGYKGYSRSVSSSRGPLTAVYVGPVLSRADVERLQRELAQEFDLNGLVVEFTIEDPPE